MLESKKYYKYLRKIFFNKNRLNYLILYITSKCNSNCKTCFFHNQLNKKDDLSFEEYKKLSQNLGELSVLLLSGGEPFLREDIFEICSLFIKNNHIDTLSIPTNGFFTDKITGFVKKMSKNYPDTALAINVSLDGLEKTHDSIRGLKNSFKNALETINELIILKKQNKNLQVIVNSVILKDNLEELKKLSNFLSRLNIDYHAFEIMRGDPRDKKLNQAEIKDIKNIHKFIINKRKERTKNFLDRIIVIGSLNYIFKIKEDYLKGKNWPFTCAAGKSILVLYPNGDLSLCELKEPLGNIRNNNYSIKNILKKQETIDEINKIRNFKCSCTHICFLNTSLAKELKSIPKIVLHSFAK